MDTKNSPIRFHSLFKHRLPEKRKLQNFLRGLFKTEKKQLTSLDYIFCSDEYLLSINQGFLQHNDLTDIITFELSTEKGAVEGEIYISIERVKENAVIFQTSFQDELRRVMFHGALHLCGFKDKTKSQQAEMRKKEDFYLKKYNR